MADLPIVVLREIFDFLTIPERLRVRSTCKTWKFVIETFKSPKSLCIYSTSYPYNEKWCFSNEKVAENEMFYLKYHYEAHRRFSLQMRFFRNLERVYLYSTKEKADLFLAEVHQLTQLKVLMIEGNVQFKTLRSSSIEKLSLRTIYHSIELELETPNLNSIVMQSMLSKNDPLVIFRFPSKVKHLECLRFNEKLSQLKNLETLVCQEITFDFQLSEFESLKRLEIWPTDHQLPMVVRIQQERNRLKRNDLELIVSGFREELISCERDRSCLNVTTAYLQQMERNRTKLVGPAPWCASLDIDTFIRHPDRFTDELFEHFPNVIYTHGYSIRRLMYNQPHNRTEDQGTFESRLIEILQKIKPRELELIGLDLTERFFDQIASLESIKRLTLEISLKNFNFHCLLSLRNLEFLRIHRVQTEIFSIDFLCELVKRQKFLYIAQFSVGSLVIFMEFEIRRVNFTPEQLYTPFCLYYDYAHGQERRKKFVTRFSNADEMAVGIRRMSQDEQIQQYFVRC